MGNAGLLGALLPTGSKGAMYDLIGDIHGHADALQRLLKTLGYSRQKGVYRHTGRQAIFLGDFIDRGTKIRETLEIVRPVVEPGAGPGRRVAQPLFSRIGSIQRGRSIASCHPLRSLHAIMTVLRVL
jgi:hypothetical protein